MGADAILLLDFDPTSSLCARVHEILAPAQTSEVQLQLESVLAYDVALRDAEVRRVLSRVNPSLVFLSLPSSAPDDSRESTASLFQLLTAPTIVAMERCEPEEMLKLLDLGATDFISPPFSPLSILPRTWRLLDQTRSKQQLKRALTQKLGLKQLVGVSPAFVAQVERIPLVAKTDATVLILGETGTKQQLPERVLARLTAKGSFITMNGKPDVYLDGEAFARPSYPNGLIFGGDPEARRRSRDVVLACAARELGGRLGERFGN